MKRFVLITMMAILLPLEAGSRTLPPLTVHLFFYADHFPVSPDAISGKWGYPYIREYILENLLPITSILEAFPSVYVSVYIPPEILQVLNNMDIGKGDSL